MNNFFLYRFSLLVLLFYLSTRTLAKNTTNNHTESEEDHDSHIGEIIEDFFKDFGDGNGSIIASQFCNFTQKLSVCGSKGSEDGHGHAEHGDEPERTEEHLEEGKHDGDTEEEGHDKDKTGHEEDEDGHEDGHEDEERHEDEEGKVRSCITMCLFDGGAFTFFQNGLYDGTCLHG